MGGLAAGCYSQMNGYNTQIFEMHAQPGGQCTAWKRSGYTFDVCVHHLYGCHPKSIIYQMWHADVARAGRYAPSPDAN